MGLEEFKPDAELVRERLENEGIDVRPYKHSGLDGEWSIDSVKVSIAENTTIINLDETVVVEGDYDDVLEELKSEVVVDQAVEKLSDELEDKQIPHTADAQGFGADENKYLKYLVELAFQGTATDNEVNEVSPIDFNSQRTNLKDKGLIDVVTIDTSDSNIEVYAPTIEGYRTLFEIITPAELEDREWFDELAEKGQVEVVQMKNSMGDYDLDE